MGLRDLQVVIAVLCLLTQVGCPSSQHNFRQADGANIKLPSEPDRYDQIASCLHDQSLFEKELARLQELYADPPTLQGAERGDNDARFGLSAEVSDGRAELLLANRYGGPNWRLTCWEEDSQSGASIQSRVTPMADGLKLELQLSSGIAVTILARWVQGRFLQLSREVLQGGTDIERTVHAGGCRWRLSGPWMPYRLVPAEYGPFGVVPEEAFGGEWQQSSYPQQAILPALCAFSQTSGVLIASTDSAAKELSRCYDLSWRMDGSYKDGPLLELGYRYFDGIQDDYVAPHIVSGLPVRDSLVLEPFELKAKAADSDSVEALSCAVIGQLAQLSRCFWFQPKPPPGVPAGTVLALEEWVSNEEGLDERLRMATGVWNAQLNEVLLTDEKLGDSGYGGIGAVDIGGNGVSRSAAQILSKLNGQQLPSLQFSDYARVKRNSAYGRRLGGWLLDGVAGSDDPELAQLDLRNSQALAWVLRKHAADLEAVPELSGYRVPVAKLDYAGRPNSAPRIVSAAQSAALTQLALAEQVQSRNEGSIIAFTGLPILALPACGNAYGISPAPECRLLGLLVEQVFGIQPWLVPADGSLSSMVLCGGSHIRGYALPKALTGNRGFEAFAANSRALEHAGNEIRFIYSDPAAASYTTSGEPPARAEAMIATQPASWRGARAIWICFTGIGGSLSLDTHNQLTISSDAGQWVEQLPGGIWSIEHPQPDSVQPGDAVLIKQRPIKPPTTELGAPS